MSIIEILSWVVRMAVFLVIMVMSNKLLTAQFLLSCPNASWQFVFLYQTVVIFSTFILYSTIGYLFYLAFITSEYERLGIKE